MEGVIRVVIVCLNRLLRESLAHELSQQTCITVIHSVAEALDLSYEISEPRPDVIITDFSSLKRDKLVYTRQIPLVDFEAKLLVIGLNELQSELLECIEAGALGCLSLDASLDDLHNQIRAIASGGALCSPEVTKFLFTKINENASERERLQALNLTQLTRREREMMGLIEQGFNNKEIAEHLKIELQTVKNHVHNILEKLQLSNRREAAKYAREEGFIRNLAGVPVVRVNGERRP
jgi:DNA-binding NarL/FixJ family response regulator